MSSTTLNKFLIVISLIAWISPSFAETKVWDSTKDATRTPAKEGEVKPQGWKKSANLGLNLSFTSSQSVVGQTDGNSQTYGVNSKGSLNRYSDADEWRNEFSLTGATTKTPTIPRFVKSSDELKLGTIYLYSLPSVPKIGPYVRAEAAAPIFKGEDVRTGTQTYKITHLSGPDTTRQDSSIRLTDGFKPLTTKEAAGFFYKPYEDERTKIETRAGLGAQQIASRGQFAVTGVDSAGAVMVKELDDVNQAGLELAASVKGKLNDVSTYEVGAESLTPFISNKKSDDHRNAIELTNVEAFAKVSSNITSWASFGYDYKLKIEPQLITRAQQIHMLVLNVNYNLF